jgi:hypothetical protein
VHCGNGFDAGLPRYKRRGDCDLRTVPHHKQGTNQEFAALWLGKKNQKGFCHGLHIPS